jgi:hypothetical protein
LASARVATVSVLKKAYSARSPAVPWAAQRSHLFDREKCSREGAGSSCSVESQRLGSKKAAADRRFGGGSSKMSLLDKKLAPLRQRAFEVEF